MRRACLILVIAFLAPVVPAHATVRSMATGDIRSGARTGQVKAVGTMWHQCATPPAHTPSGYQTAADCASSGPLVPTGCAVTTQLFTLPHSLVITRYYTDTFVQTSVSCDEPIVDCVTFGDVLIGLPSFMIGVQPANGAGCSPYNTSPSLIGPLPNTAAWTVCVTYTDGVVTCGDLTVEGF